MTAAHSHSLTHLPPAATRLGHAFARPKIIAIVCVVALTSLGWGTLGLMSAEQSFLSALCRPAAGLTGVSGAAMIWLMWCAMTLAMMLPTAGGMIWTYAEIADTAAKKGERIVSPLTLAAGYATVWLGFAAVAAALQAALIRAGVLTPTFAASSALLSGAIFIAAGAYQFSELKHACLKACQQPFQFFFVNWTTSARGVFRLGFRQGLFCLGCCWAMMLVMFAVGAMNVAWMAALGAIMTIEKMSTNVRFTRAVGFAFVGIGAAFIALVFFSS